MLNRVVRALAQQGWIDAAVRYERLVQLTRASGICMILVRDGLYETYVKFSPHMDYADEAARSAAAHAAHPNLTARFLGHIHVDGVDIMASQALQYQELAGKDLLTGQLAAKVASALTEYFTSMASAGIPKALPAVGNLDLPAVLRDYFKNHPLSACTEPWLGPELDEKLAVLTPLPQHGDFVLNNLGDIGRTLVIFDWEDYARIQLPGMDLYSLLMSLGLGGVRSVVDYGQNHPELPELVRRLCGAMKLPVQVYESLIPIYLLTFLYLKRDYARAVQQHMETLLQGLDPGIGIGPA